MKVLVANRGEIACRILRTLRDLGVPSVAIYAAEEQDAPHVWLADEAVALDEPTDYLDIAQVVMLAQKAGADCIHPGYGFLSERAPFARACRDADIVFVGPSPEAMDALGDKRSARTLAEKVGVPVVPGAESCDTVSQAKAAAAQVGYPVVLKAAAGGGGRGMRRVGAEDELAEAFHAARRESKAAFGDDRLLVEKYVHPARHVEIQILADGTNAIALGERECSLQRRHQKLVEESPSPGIGNATREAMQAAAVRLAEAVGYSNAGTVEFLVGADESYYFLEVNARLQVEHPVTELRTGLDLVAAQLEIAKGASVPETPPMRGHAIEVRLNAEDPYSGFLPQIGEVVMLQWPQRPGVRVDAGIVAGQKIGTSFDSLLAKIIAWGSDREQARQRLAGALRETTLLGVFTNQSFLLDVIESDFFAAGETFTTTVEHRPWSSVEPPAEVIAAANQALRRRADAMAAEGRVGLDRHSPWQQLGAFRMGTSFGEGEEQ